MKIGSLEGTPEEINSVMENNGINLADFLEKPEIPLSKTWLILPSVLLVISFSILTLYMELSHNIKILIFLFGLSSGIWLAVSVHIRFKSVWGAGAIILSSLLIMLVALGVITPSELLEEYKKMHNKTS